MIILKKLAIYSHGNVHVLFAVLTRWHENVCISACRVRACVRVCACMRVCVCTGRVRNELIHGHASVTVVDTNSLQVYSVHTRARALVRTHAFSYHLMIANRRS